MLTPLQPFCVCSMLLFGVIHAEGTGGEKVVVREGDDAILPCSLSTKEDINFKLFDWMKDAKKDERQEVFMYDAGIHYNNGLGGQSKQFKGRVSHFPEELKHGNASIIIRNTKVTDSGDYTCVFPRLRPQRQIFQIQLIVGASPEPYIRTLRGPSGSALLQCEVRGAFPEPSVEWRNSSGHGLPAEELQVSERGGRFYITLNVTVTKADNYRCIVTQEEISHQISAETFVHISVREDSSSKVIGGVFGGFIAASALAAVLALLVARHFFTKKRKTENDPSDDDTKMSLKNGDSHSELC